MPHSTFVADMGFAEDKSAPEVVQHVEAGKESAV